MSYKFPFRLGRISAFSLLSVYGYTEAVLVQKRHVNTVHAYVSWTLNSAEGHYFTHTCHVPSYKILANIYVL